MLSQLGNNCRRNIDFTESNDAGFRRNVGRTSQPFQNRDECRPAEEDPWPVAAGTEPGLNRLVIRGNKLLDVRRDTLADVAPDFRGQPGYDVRHFRRTARGEDDLIDAEIVEHLVR